MQQPRFPMPSSRGVVDLSALRKPAGAPSTSTNGSVGPAAPAGAGGTSGASPAGDLVVEVTEATFAAEVAERSRDVPVVIDFWAEWCGPCKQLSPILERLAQAYGGRFVLAKIDVDANQALAGQFGVQSIPAVFAVLAGQLVPLFQGALPEAQVRDYLDQLLTLAQQQFGMAGPPDGAEAAADLPEPPHDPAFDAAYDALDAGDVDGAARAFQNVLTAEPGNADAKAGLAQVELLQRTRGADPAAVRAAAAERPDDVAAQLVAADVDMLGGHVEDAVARLVETVGRAAGDDREQARVRLLDYFAMLGPDDPRVVSGRAALMRVLF